MTTPEEYDDAKHYPVVLEACRRAGGPEISAPVLTLQAAGVNTAVKMGRNYTGEPITPEVAARTARIDAAIRKAWVELGYAKG